MKILEDVNGRRRQVSQMSFAQTKQAAAIMDCIPCAAAAMAPAGVALVAAAATAFVAPPAACTVCGAAVAKREFVKAIACAVTGDDPGASTSAAAAFSSSGSTFFMSRMAFSTTSSPCRTLLWNAA